jgi:hypothetical protein
MTNGIALDAVEGKYDSSFTPQVLAEVKADAQAWLLTGAVPRRFWRKVWRRGMARLSDLREDMREDMRDVHLYDLDWRRIDKIAVRCMAVFIAAFIVWFLWAIADGSVASVIGGGQ